MAEAAEYVTFFYEKLGLTDDEGMEMTAKAVQKAYRKLALKYHPDKNKAPDAATIFDKLSKAHEYLTDEATRQKIETKLRAKQERKRKNALKNAAHRKMVEALEKREQQYEQEQKQRKRKADVDSIQRENDAFVKRMRREGKLRSKGLFSRGPSPSASQMSPLTPKTMPSPPPLASTAAVTPKSASISVKWKRTDRTVEGEAHTEESLRNMFSVYGRIAHLIIRGKKRRALVEFESVSEAKLAQASINASKDNLFSAKLMSGDNDEDVSMTDHTPSTTPSTTPRKPNSSSLSFSSSSFISPPQTPTASTSTATSSATTNPRSSSKSYENDTLMRMMMRARSSKKKKRKEHLEQQPQRQQQQKQQQEGQQQKQTETASGNGLANGQ